MNETTANVNPPVEPVLFPGGAICVTLEAMLDPEEGTVLFCMRAMDVGVGKLIALWSSAPVPFEDYGRTQWQALKEFGDVVKDHSGPF